MQMLSGEPANSDKVYDPQVHLSDERFLKFEETGPNCKPVIVLNTVPDSLTIDHIRSIFASSSGNRRPWLKSIDEIQWVRHKSGGFRKKLLAEVSPPDDDPALALLPCRISLPKLGEIVVGCTRHFCSTCNKSGHKASVHDEFCGKRGELKKHPNSDQRLLQTPAMKVILEDSLLELQENSTRKESWRCEGCKKRGFGYFTALNHIQRSTSHQIQLQHLKQKRLVV